MDYTKEQIIEALGLKDTEPEKQDALVGAVYSTLNLRVGTILADKLNEEQLDKFNALTDDNDDAATSWLSENVPDFKELANNEMKNVIDEIKERVDKITQK